MSSPHGSDEEPTIVLEQSRLPPERSRWVRLIRFLRRGRSRTLILPQRADLVLEDETVSSLRSRLQFQRTLRARTQEALVEARRERDELLHIVELVRASWAHVPPGIKVPDYVVRVRSHGLSAAGAGRICPQSR